MIMLQHGTKEDKRFWAQISPTLIIKINFHVLTRKKEFVSHGSEGTKLWISKKFMYKACPRQEWKKIHGV